MKPFQITKLHNDFTSKYSTCLLEYPIVVVLNNPLLKKMFRWCVTWPASIFKENLETKKCFFFLCFLKVMSAAHKKKVKSRASLTPCCISSFTKLSAFWIQGDQLLSYGKCNISRTYHPIPFCCICNFIIHQMFSLYVRSELTTDWFNIFKTFLIRVFYCVQNISWCCFAEISKIVSEKLCMVFRL